MAALCRLHRLALIALFGVLNLFAGTNDGSFESTSEKLRQVLYGHIAGIDAPPLNRVIGEFQRLEGCSTSTVVSLMATWATNNWNSRNRKEKHVALMSASALKWFPSQQARDALIYLLGCDGFSHRSMCLGALLSWRHVYDLDDIFKDIIDDQSEDNLDSRLLVYHGYMEDARRLPIGSEEQRQAISNLQYCFNIDTNDSTRLSLDRVLYSRCTAHSNSVSRIKWLEQMKECSVREWSEYARQMMLTNAINPR